MAKERDVVLVAGFAQFPKGTPVYELHKVIGCILIVDKNDEIIVDATFTFLMDTTRDFIKSLVCGQSIKEGIGPLIEKMERQINIPGQKALIQSFINAYERYRLLKEEENSIKMSDLR